MKLNKNQKFTLTVLVFGLLFLFVSFLLDSLVQETARIFQSNILDYLFNWVSYIISLIFVLLVMTSLFMWEEHKKDWIIPLWFSTFFALAVSYAIKFIVARERPEQAMYIFGIQDFSFPSAHAAMSFAAVPILDREYPQMKWFWILFAVIVAVSRLYLDVHFLSDVIAGALIGYSVGKTVIYIKKKYSVFG